MNQLVQKYLQRKSLAFKIKNTKTTRIQKHIQKRLDKKIEDWKLKPSPYEQKLITVQHKFYRTSRKTLKGSQLNQNNKKNRDSEKSISKLVAEDKNFQCQFSLLTPHFNLFKDEISLITTKKSFRQFSNEKNYRVKSAIILRSNHNTTSYISRPQSGLVTIDKKRQVKSPVRKSMLNNDTERYGLHSQRKITRKIIIFEKGIIIKNKK